MPAGNNLYKKAEYLLFFSGQANYKPFVFFRIAAGLFILIHFIAIMGDIGLLFGPDGILPMVVTELYVDPLVITRGKLIDILHIDPAIFNRLYNGLYILLSFCIITGFLTRISALLLLLLNISLIKSNVFFAYGVDFFTSMSLFYLILFPSNKRYALDYLISKMPDLRPDQYLIYQRYLQLHLCFAYFFSGFNKILGYNWRNGEAIWKAIKLPYANLDFNVPVNWLAGVPFLLTILGWGIVILELLYPVILYKQIRKHWLLAVIFMHLGIALIINLYFFSSIMIIWNITAFYPFDDFQKNTVAPVSLP